MPTWDDVLVGTVWQLKDGGHLGDISFEGFLLFSVSVLKRDPFLFGCINLIIFDDQY